jgi:hypothetical protein
MEVYRFDPVLASVKESGRRTRGVIYINMILIALTFTLIRNYVFPAWDDRLEREALFISDCVDKADVGLAPDQQCLPDLRNIFGINGLNEVARGTAKRDIVDRHIANVIDNRTRHESFQIPIFGIFIN